MNYERATAACVSTLSGLPIAVSHVGHVRTRKPERLASVLRRRKAAAGVRCENRREPMEFFAHALKIAGRVKRNQVFRNGDAILRASSADSANESVGDESVRFDTQKKARTKRAI